MPNTPIRFAVLLAVLLACSCASPAPPPEAPGEALARHHCSSCHAFPEPDLLDEAS